MKIVIAVGNNVRNAVSAAKKELGNMKLRIAHDEPSEGGMHRVTLTNGDVVEVTVIKHIRCLAKLLP